MEIELTVPVMKLDVKRLYHGYKITDKCPKCGRTVQYREHDNYLSHPMVGAPMDIWFYCDPCDTEWMALIKLVIKIEPA